MIRGTRGIVDGRGGEGKIAARTEGVGCGKELISEGSLRVGGGGGNADGGKSGPGKGSG